MAELLPNRQLDTPEQSLDGTQILVILADIMLVI
jgi:hypothetical protein